MFKSTITRHAVKGISQLTTRPAALAARSRPALSSRAITSTVPRLNSNSNNNNNGSNKRDPFVAATTKAPEGASGGQEGQYARTDESVKIEYPEDHEMPPQPIVQGRGGMHFRRTLAQFSLEGRVGLVTGGARGLGLVMAQALVASGSDLAIVDLNRTRRRLSSQLERRLTYLTRGGS